MDSESSSTGVRPLDEVGALRRIQTELSADLRKASEMIEAERKESDAASSRREDRIAALKKSIEELEREVAEREEKIRQLAERMLEEREEIPLLLKAQTAAAQEHARNQLAYRFGRAMLKVGRNPLRMLALPITLVREYRRHSPGGRERPEIDPPERPHPFQLIDYTPPSEEAEAEQDATAEAELTASAPPPDPPPAPPMVEIDVARSLTLKSLAELSAENLVQLGRRAFRDGDLTMQKHLAELAWMKNRSRENSGRLRLILGKLKELDPSWLPRLERNSSFTPDPKKILHIFKVLYPQESTGGAVRNWSVWRNQALIGLEPVAVLPPGPIDGNLIPEARGKTGLIRVSEDARSTYFCNMPGLDAKKIARDASLTFETSLLDHIARIEKPSIIHAASGFRGYETALKGLAVARAHDLPFVYEVRSFHEHAWGPIRDDIHDLEETRLRTAQEHRCMAEADGVVTISEAMKRELIGRGIAERKITVVPNCLDADFFENIDPADVVRFKKEWNIEASTVIGYISNLSAREGHSVLVEAFARLADARPDTKLLLVGDGPNYESLQADIARRGLEDRVILTGLIDHKQIGSAYSAIDLFVVPRVKDYASDFVTPMKPFEAMAVGCPLIMSDRPVSREVIGDDRGLLFKAGDAEDLVAAIDRCLDNPEDTAVRMERARSWVRDCRRWTDVIHRYEQVYEDARTAHSIKQGVN